MRPNTRKGKIGKRRVYLTDADILRESPDGRLYRVPIYGSKLITGHWYVDIHYTLTKTNERGLVESDRWRHPVFLHFAGYGSVVEEDGDEIVVCLFNEIINDSGTRYVRKMFGSDGLFSLGGVSRESPLFQPTPFEIEKVKRRASEKRHNWSK